MIKTIKSKKDMEKIRKYIRYESPSDGKVHDLLQKWDEKYFPEEHHADRLKKIDERAKNRSSLLGR